MDIKAKIILLEILEDLRISGDLHRKVDVIIERLAENDLFIVSEKGLNNWQENVLTGFEKHGVESLEEADIREVWAAHFTTKGDKKNARRHSDRAGDLLRI